MKRGKPVLRFRAKDPIPFPPTKANLHGVKSLVFQNKLPTLFIRQPVLDKGQVQVFVAAVEFVANDRVPDVREMNTDLVLPASPRPNIEQRKLAFNALETADNRTFRFRRRSVVTHLILNGNDTVIVPAQGSVDNKSLRRDMAVNHRAILLFNRPRFPNAPEFTCSLCGLSDNNHPARLAIQPIDKVGMDGWPKMQADAADKTRPCVAFGGMTDEPSRLVDNQQVRILIEHVEQFHCKQAI